MTLTEFSLRRPVTVIMIYVAVFVLGVIAFYKIPLEFLPSQTGPNLWIQFFYRNSTPAEVEKTIAMPAEQLLATVSGLKKVQSVSNRDRCSLILDFEWDIDMDYAYMEVKDRLDRLAAELPKESEKYYIWRFSSEDIAVMWVALSMEGRSGEVYEMVDSRLKPRLQRIEGVGNIEVWGRRGKEIFIDISQDRLKSHGVSLYELVLRLERYNVNLASGEIDEGGRRYLVRSVDEYRSLEDLRAVPLGTMGLRLGDVAEVRYDYPDQEFVTFMDGHPSVAIGVFKESRANTVDVCAHVRRTLAEFKEERGLEDLHYSIAFDQSTYILNSFEGLKNAGKIGSLLAIIVLFYFLRRVRGTLIVACAIPVSILVAVTIMFFANMTLNIVSMVGLMLAVGMLVDNSIVVSENIFRYRDLGADRRGAAVRGADEVAMAILSSTLTTIIVFLPMIFMKMGLMKVYTREIGVSIGLSLLASLFVALTSIPLVASRILKERPPSEAGLIVRARGGYVGALRWALDHKLTTVLLIALLVALTIVLPVRRVGERKQEPSDMRQIILNIEMDGARDVERARRIFATLEETLLPLREELDITHTIAQSGYFYEVARFQIFLTDADRARLTTAEVWERVKEIVPEIPGARIRILAGMDMTGEGGEDSVRVVVAGERLDVLYRLAEDVRSRLEGVEELTDIDWDFEVGKDEVEVSVDRDRAKAHGVNPAVVAQTIAFGLRGYPLPRLKAADREIDVTARLRLEDRENLSKLKELQVTTERGEKVALGNVADFTSTPGLQAIQRSRGKRVISVKGRSTAKAMSETKTRIEEALRGLDRPEGYSVFFGESLIDLEETKRAFIGAIALAVLLIYFLLGALFESYIQPLSILMAVPLAMVGSYWVMYVSGTPMDVAAYIGLILLVGIVVNNAIVIIDHINSLRRKGMTRSEAILHGGEDRFRPVLMTAITTILGLLPIALGRSSIGGVLMFAPMGRAVIGGLATSTLLTLFVVPIVYSMLDDLRTWLHAMAGAVRR